VVLPMVGWKQEPISAVASRFPVSDKYFHTLRIEMEMMIEYIYMSVTEFCNE
jgi:hypothetical protein